MSYRQSEGYRGEGSKYSGRGYPPRERQQLNYDDLDGDSNSTGLPAPRRDYPSRGYDDDRYGRGGYDRRDYRDDRRHDSRRSRSPPSRRDEYSHSHRDRADSRPSRRSPSPDSSRRRSRSPPPTRRQHSRSPSPPRRRDRTGERVRDRGERDRSSPPPPRRSDGRDRGRSESLVTADDAADVETQDIAAMMGFGGFGTTQGKQHEGELSGASIKQERAHRQYMNRKGGFNRPLDKIK
ncbi:SNUT3/LISCH7 family protein [Sporobolomyces koalae]|uniref:SNUT3/LISCH7 family protein n=1 Tax=Sporobolomyces koalae TaxID=500713 RepID=UPI003177104F